MKIRLLLLAMSAGFMSNAQIISTQYGQIQGSMNGNVYQFLGIPFAKPPVDTLRWKPTLPPDSWLNILHTTSFAPKCPQKNFVQGDTTYTFEGDEDCLYLNVWTPQTAQPNLPVLVFIHGGGQQQGGASETAAGTQLYHGKNMAERGNAVVVTIQYRLGPLGYLVHPGLEQESPNGKSGNYAVLDQIMALKWVKNNISNFGGDTTKVMIFGESAGGVNVGNLLTSPLAAGLFQRACIQSAVPIVNDYADSKNKGINFVNGFTNTGTDAQKITYMRSLHRDSLIKELSSPLEGGVVQMNWQPSLDNYVFTNYAEQAFQIGNYNKVPLIIGSNADEMSLSVPPTVTPGMVTLLINNTVPAPLQSQALTLYPPGTTNAQAKASYIGILTDAQFTATSRRTARCISQNQSEPVWRYFFTHKHPAPAYVNALGAYHGIELFYVFNNIENTTIHLANNTTQDAKDDSVQTAVLNYWINFANTGNPNGLGLVTWPQYLSTTDCYIELKPSPNGNQCGIRTSQSDLWDNAIGYTGCITTSSNDISDDINTMLLLYPNPTTHILHIDTKDLSSIKISIFDCTGKKQYYSENNTEVNTAGLSSGMYFISIEQNNKTYRTKFIKN